VLVGLQKFAYELFMLWVFQRTFVSAASAAAALLSPLLPSLVHLDALLERF